MHYQRYSEAKGNVYCLSGSSLRAQVPKCKCPAPAPTPEVPGQKDGAGHHPHRVSSGTPSTRICTSLATCILPLWELFRPPRDGAEDQPLQCSYRTLCSLEAPHSPSSLYPLQSRGLQELQPNPLTNSCTSSPAPAAQTIRVILLLPIFN